VAFVRKKQTGSHSYYYLVESYRTGNKNTPRQRVLMYLGKNPTVEDTVADWSQRAEENRREAQEWEDESDAIQEWLDDEVGYDEALDAVEAGSMSEEEFEELFSFYPDLDELLRQRLQIALVVGILKRRAAKWEQRIEQLRAAANPESKRDM
jgi:hypothetical protein